MLNLKQVTNQVIENLKRQEILISSFQISTFFHSIHQHCYRTFFGFGGAMGHKMTMPADHELLPGRETKMRVSPTHTVNNNPTIPPFPENTEMTIFGMGCFRGVERKFWKTKGVFSTHVGYSAGTTPNPSYEEVCTEILDTMKLSELYLTQRLYHTKNYSKCFGKT